VCGGGWVGGGGSGGSYYLFLLLKDKAVRPTAIRRIILQVKCLDLGCIISVDNHLH